MTALGKSKEIILPSMNPEKVADEIADFVIDQIVKPGYTGGVIGLSGGIDSTASAALVKRAFDKYNEKNNANLELVGYLLPSNTNDPKDTEDGQKVAEQLGIRYETISIEPVVKGYETALPKASSVDYHKGNTMSRIRANVLSTQAALEHKLLIGTGNKDEDFGIGYYTLFGDGAVHLSPIGGLPKRLVREMASFLGFDNYFVNRVPAAGLEPGQTDFGDLGYGYDVVELVTEGMEQDVGDLYSHPQIVEMVKPQLAESKYDTVKQVVNDIRKRHNVALAKAKIIHPPIAPITLNYEVEE